MEMIIIRERLGVVREIGGDWGGHGGVGEGRVRGGVWKMESWTRSKEKESGEGKRKGNSKGEKLLSICSTRWRLWELKGCEEETET